jgi:signal transduction histidine kinase
MKSKAVQVVMIDDDKDDFLLVKDLLARGAYTSYDTVWVPDYDAGLRELRSGNGDVFLLDYNLGSANGLDLLKEAGGRMLSKPVIMLTGVVSAEVDLSALEAGASYFVQKSNLVIDHLLERTIRYAIKTVKDFQELREVDRLRIEKNAAEAASESKSHFLAAISHELRTPLSAIVGFSDLAKDCSSDEEQRRYLEIISRNANNLIVLTNDLLDLAKIEAGKFEPMVEPCDWRKAVYDVIETLKFSAKKKGNEIEFIDSERIPNLIGTDPHSLQQILLNVIGNAVKFTENGKIEVYSEFGPDLKIFIRDTGMGISQEQQGRLFQPYTQCDNKLKRKFGGTGLGLSLSRKMALALGGGLELTFSKEGSGSIFALTLPGSPPEVEA